MHTTYTYWPTSTPENLDEVHTALSFLEFALGRMAEVADQNEYWVHLEAVENAHERIGEVVERLENYLYMADYTPTQA